MPVRPAARYAGYGRSLVARTSQPRPRLGSPESGHGCSRWQFLPEPAADSPGWSSPWVRTRPGRTP